MSNQMKIRIVSNMISAALHVKADCESIEREEAMKIAEQIKECLDPIYSLNSLEWSEVIEDMESYIDFLKVYYPNFSTEA